MRGVVAHDDQDTLSVVRATAVALGLPLLVLELSEGLDALEGAEQRDEASAALVLVVRRPRRASTLLASPGLAIAPGADVVPPDTSFLTRRGISGDGGIVRFDLGDRGTEARVEKQIFEDHTRGTDRVEAIRAEPANGAPKSAEGRSEG
jgi:hypothetical protein